MNKNEYSADLVNKGFWFTEFKKTIELYQIGKTSKEIKKMQEEENVYLAPSPDTGKRMVSTLRKRVECLPPEIVEQFLSFDISTQKMINLLAIMKNNMLFLSSCMKCIEKRECWVKRSFRTAVYGFSSKIKRSRVKKWPLLPTQQSKDY